MRYVIMLGIVILVAFADWITGFIKAVVLGKVSSKVMRIGGLKKIAEIIVMIVGIVLDIGISALAIYYPSAQQLAEVLGVFCAITIFAYILVMEIVSILENYAAIFPDAKWAVELTKKLKNIEQKEG